MTLDDRSHIEEEAHNPSVSQQLETTEITKSGMILKQVDFYYPAIKQYEYFKGSSTTKPYMDALLWMFFL
jgi:hypothetical protein